MSASWIFVVVILIICCFFANSTSKKNQQNLSGQIAEDDHWKKIESVQMREHSDNELYNRYIALYRSAEGFFNGDQFTQEEKLRMREDLKNINNEYDKNIIEEMDSALFFGRDTEFMHASYEGIQLLPGEKCFFKAKNSILNTIQTLYKKIHYSNFRGNLGYYRSGSLYLDGKDVQGFRAVGAGTTYITNKRIIFMGNNNENKTVNISSVLSYLPYEDNAVLINISNNKPIIINFDVNGMFYFSDPENVVSFHDDKIQCLYALDKAFEDRE